MNDSTAVKAFAPARMLVRLAKVHTFNSEVRELFSAIQKTIKKRSANTVIV